MASPTSRSLQLARQMGYLAAPVECATKRMKRDLYRFGDVLALHPEKKDQLIIQACMMMHRTNRLAKIYSLLTCMNCMRLVGDRCEKCEESQLKQTVEVVLMSGARVEVWAWRKLKQNGRYLWTPHFTEIMLDRHFTPEKPLVELEKVYD